MSVVPIKIPEFSDSDYQNAGLLEGMIFSGNHLELAADAALTGNHVLIGADLMKVRQMIVEEIKALINRNHTVVQLLSRDAQRLYWDSIYFDPRG
jgi:hypothetical protein